MSKVLGGLKVTFITLANANTGAFPLHARLCCVHSSLNLRFACQAHLDAGRNSFPTGYGYLD